jgi:hypothetical protein
LPRELHLPTRAGSSFALCSTPPQYWSRTTGFSTVQATSRRIIVARATVWRGVTVWRLNLHYDSILLTRAFTYLPAQKNAKRSLEPVRGVRDLEAIVCVFGGIV